MIRNSTFSKEEYSIDTFRKEQPKKPPTKETKVPKDRDSVNRKSRLDKKESSIDGVTNASVMSKGSRLNDLCDEDKNKIGVLIKTVAEKEQERNQLEQEKQRIEQEYLREIRELRNQNLKLIQGSKEIQEKYKETLLMAKRVEKLELKSKQSRSKHSNNQSKSKDREDHQDISDGPQKKTLKSNKIHPQVTSSMTLPKAMSSNNKLQNKTQVTNLDEKLDKRYLIMKRDGDSLEKMNQPSDEEEKDEGIINRKNYKEEIKFQEEIQKDRAVRTKLERKDLQKKTTLNDILKLKEEIEEVSSTLRSLDVVNIKGKLEQQKDKFKKDLDRKLDNFQTKVLKDQVKTVDTQKYIDTLRSAYERTSSEEDPDEMTDRILLKQKKELQKVRASYQKEIPSKQIITKDKYKQLVDQRDLSDDDSALQPKQVAPKRIQKNSRDVSSEDGSLEKPYQNQKAVRKGAIKMKQQKSRTNTETNREKEMLDSFLTDRKLDQMNDEELKLIKNIIEKRLNESEREVPAEDEGIHINDDYYDEKFLSLVYEIESQQNNESLLN